MFKSDGTKKVITKDEVLNNIGERQVYYWLLGFYPEPYKKYRNPLRDDRSAGTYFQFKGDRIFYIDKAWGKEMGKTKFDIFDLVGFRYNKTLFRDILQVIQTQFGIPDRTAEPIKYTFERRYMNFKLELRDFNQKDLVYWNAFGISLTTLQDFHVRAVYKAYMNEAFQAPFSYKPHVYAAFVEQQVKLYNPFGHEKYKWRTNIPGNKCFGLHLLDPNYEGITFITSSFKDCMTLHNLGYQSIAPQTETLFVNEDALRMLKNPVIFYDNDETGIHYANEFSAYYEIPFIHTPIGQPKDPSDYVYSKGREGLVSVIKDANIMLR